MGVPFDLIIFDCDGVLIDSETISARTLIGLLEPFGVQIDFNYIQRHFLGRSFPTIAETIRADFDVTLSEGFEAMYRRVLLDAFKTELRPTKGIETVLRHLDIPFCVATSSSPERALRSLEMTGLAPYFADRVFTASDVPNGKPAPDLFLHVAATLGADPARCLVVEDSLSGLQAGHSAGMTIWRYIGGGHLDGAVRPPPAALGAVTYLNTWSDFSELLAKT